jgi:hypothetical protein
MKSKAVYFSCPDPFPISAEFPLNGWELTAEKLKIALQPTF